jgi:hypothetical protein
MEQGDLVNRGGGPKCFISPNMGCHERLVLPHAGGVESSNFDEKISEKCIITNK